MFGKVFSNFELKYQIIITYMYMEDNKIGIASDHAGYQMKEFLVGYLGGMGYDVHDFGTFSEESVDYPDFAHPLGEAIDSGELKRGIALCGSGNGITMTLNKHQGVRAALCWSAEIASLARKHNNANVCGLPARFIENTEAADIVSTFLETKFEGGRHERRIEKIPVKPSC
jgi:ribose 5-phosphate isomerase B